MAASGTTSEAAEPAANSRHDSGRPTDDEALEARNILVLVIHQVFFRTAWIFKIESVIMPAFLDSITSVGWLRGMLPLLNRFGQALVPLLLSERLSQTTRKATWLSRTTFFMSLPFLSLGALLLVPELRSQSWFVYYFLAAYLTFFCLHGVNQASFNTIQGKLIRPNRRGRLIMLASVFGTPVAVSMAWLLLRPWTAEVPIQFSYIFLFTGSLFFLASLVTSQISERQDPKVAKAVLSFSKRLRDAKRAITEDADLKRLCQFSALFVSTQLLFPYYQRLGQSLADFQGSMLMIWVVAQFVSAALFSWIAGFIADVRGTRSALRILSFAATFAPMLALSIAWADSAAWYWMTFFSLGLVPVTYRIQLNYALELTDRQHHPIYVSTVVLSATVPILLSPLVGELVEQFDYLPTFIAITVLLALAWTKTWFMIEPRDQVK
ncbi:MAG: hypothetical protein ABJZ55_25495 [Fuerstiella sp.]